MQPKLRYKILKDEKIILDEEGNVVIEESELVIIGWKYFYSIVENLNIQRPCHSYS